MQALTKEWSQMMRSYIVGALIWRAKARDYSPVIEGRE